MKRIKTELPITIITDDEYKQGDNLEMTRQRIEKAAMLIESIFNILKVSAQTFEGDAETETQNFLWDLMNTCEIGCGLADSIMASASCLTDYQPDETEAQSE